MLSLVYVSSATALFSDEELIQLLKQAREKNSRLDITGMLLYKDGNFMQVLEGEDATVKALAEVIKYDPRHKGFIQLLEMPVTERQFADWSMGFNNLSGQDLSDMPGYSDLLEQPLDSPLFRENPGHAWTLLKTFRQNN